LIPEPERYRRSGIFSVHPRWACWVLFAEFEAQKLGPPQRLREQQDDKNQRADS
jgi:hypothetical protein